MENKKSLKEERIKKVVKKLNKMFLNSKSKKDDNDVIKELINKAAFLLVLSEDMEIQISSNKLTITTINSSQQFTKANPLLKDYRDTVKSYQTVVKQLYDFTKGKQNDSKEPDELESFINS